MPPGVWLGDLATFFNDDFISAFDISAVYAAPRLMHLLARAGSRRKGDARFCALNKAGRAASIASVSAMIAGRFDGIELRHFVV